jgi:DNA-binding LytR/AlgR family response regulator
MLKCIIVDDQPQSVLVLRNFIKKIPFLEFAGSFKNPKEALDSLKNKPADLIILDIKKTLQNNSLSISAFQLNAMVILTSSNPKLALEGFEHDAIDFLVKPPVFERFYRAVEKAYKFKRATGHRKQDSPPLPLKGGFIFIKEATRLLRVDLDDIFYVMGLKNYVSILTKSHRIVSLQTMKQIEDLLPAHRFIRVHRSYLVAIDKIISVEKSQIHVKDKVIPIGNMYASRFMKELEKITNP